MANYTVEWRNGEYVRVPKPRMTRVVSLSAADTRGSNWHVWGKPRKGRGVELNDGLTRTTR